MTIYFQIYVVKTANRVGSRPPGTPISQLENSAFIQIILL